MKLRRHDLLRPGPAAWDAMFRRCPRLAALPLVADWAGRGWPVIVRRRLANDGADAVPAALPLPPSRGKRRVALSFPPGAAMTALPPVLLRDAAPTAPAAWQETIAALVEAGDGVGMMPRVFGALLWQHATGLPYLNAGSDLDVLWDVPDQAVADALVEALCRVEASGPVRLDGELVLPDGAGVNWREYVLADRAATVLIKTMDAVEARPRGSLFSTLVSA